MDLRRIAGRVAETIVSSLERSAREERERTVSSYRYHVRQVTHHPIRTLFSVVFATLLFGVMYSIAIDTAATMAAVEAAGESPVALALALLPPVWILVPLFVVMLVVVPVSSVLSGVAYERRYGFRR